LFLRGGGGGPGRQTLVIRAEWICKLACTSASEASGYPIVRNTFSTTHHHPASKQASGHFPFPCACAARQVYYERAVWHKNLVKADRWRRINTEEWPWWLTLTTREHSGMSGWLA
jgi:hypothetical protein